jgi:hypothetical protein
MLDFSAPAGSTGSRMVESGEAAVWSINDNRTALSVLNR